MSLPVPTHDQPSIANGRYALLGRLGSGGMAQVFLGWDSLLERHCAIKVIAEGLSRKRSIRRRFAREAQAMDCVDHPNVVKVLAVDLEVKRPYLVMEIAEGGSLEPWVEMYGAMPQGMVLDVALQICDGVIAAHDHGIVHRDLKPGNVLVDAGGGCVVSDFGIAQIADATHLTSTGVAMGTWLFMPPEQRLNAKEVDHRGDIFNLGVTLFVLLTGGPPPDLCLAAQKPELLAAIEAPFRDIVARCVRFLPEDRYPTTRALKADLVDLIGRLPAEAMPPLSTPIQLEALDRPMLLDLNPMRQILMDRARAKSTLRRGARPLRVQLDVALLSTTDVDLLDLDSALRRLRRHDADLAEVALLRTFGGLSVQEIADAMGVTRRTATTRWKHAREFLQEALA